MGSKGETMINKVLDIIRMTDYWDEDLIQVTYAIGEELRLYVIHRVLNEEQNIFWKKGKFYELVFKNCTEFKFFIFDESNIRDKRIKEEYDFYSTDYIFYEIYLKKMNHSMNHIRIELHTGTIECVFEEVELNIVEYPDLKQNLELKYRRLLTDASDLNTVKSLLSNTLSQDVLAHRFSWLLDDLEFIVRDEQGKLRYLCLGKCCVANISDTTEIDLNMRVNVVDFNDYPNVWEPLYSEKFSDRGAYTEIEFNLHQQHYHMMFKLIEVGELPDGVTSFEHEFFCGE